MCAEAPLAAVVAPVEEVEEVEAAVVEEGHAVTDAGVVAAGLPIVERGPLGAEDFDIASADGGVAAGESGDVVVGEAGVPEEDLVDAGGGGDGEGRAGGDADAADGPLFVDEDAVDEEFGLGVLRSEGDGERAVKTDHGERCNEPEGATPQTVKTGRAHKRRRPEPDRGRNFPSCEHPERQKAAKTAPHRRVLDGIRERMKAVPRDAHGWEQIPTRRPEDCSKELLNPPT